jgi:hypothetical protein
MRWPQTAPAAWRHDIPPSIAAITRPGRSTEGQTMGALREQDFLHFPTSRYILP